MYVNNLHGILTAGLSAVADLISVDADLLSAVDAALLSGLGGVPLTICSAGVESGWECIQAVAVDGQQLRVQRGIDGTSARAHALGSVISCRWSAGPATAAALRAGRSAAPAPQLLPAHDGAVIEAASPVSVAESGWMDAARITLVRSTPAELIVTGDVLCKAGHEPAALPGGRIDLLRLPSGRWHCSGDLHESRSERVMIAAGSSVSVITDGVAQQVATASVEATAIYSPDSTMAVICGTSSGVLLLDTASGAISDTGLPAAGYIAIQWRADSLYVLLYSAAADAYIVIGRTGEQAALIIPGSAWPVWHGDNILASDAGGVLRWSVDGQSSPAGIPEFTISISSASGDVVAVYHPGAGWASYDQSDSLISTFEATETTMASFSPNGKRIAFQQAGTQSSIDVYSVDTGTLLQRINTDPLAYGGPAWSADAQRLWYSAAANPRLVALDTSSWQTVEQISFPASISSISTARYK